MTLERPVARRAGNPRHQGDVAGGEGGVRGRVHPADDRAHQAARAHRRRLGQRGGTAARLAQTWAVQALCTAMHLAVLRSWDLIHREKRDGE
jgi:hypothetical protein